MTYPNTDTSLRTAALVSGVGLVAMTIFAVAAIYFVFPNLIVPGNASITASNIIADEILFRIGIGCLLIVAILDVVVAWGLYLFFKPANKSLSLLSAWFRLVYATILGAALLDYVNILQLLNDPDYLKSFETDQLHTNVMLSINAFNDGWSIGLVFFGLHLSLLGYLILKSDYVPKFLGVVLVAAGLAYLIDNFGMLILPSYDMGLATFIGWGELLLMFWLLFRGGIIRN